MRKYNWTIVLMIIFILIILIFSMFYINVFNKVKRDLKHETFEYVLHEIEDTVKNIENYNNNFIGDLKLILFNNLKSRELYDKFLSSFITSNIKNFFIVYKDKNSNFFRVLADGSKDPYDKFDFNETFEPKYSSYWNKVLNTKKPVYFKSSIKGIWYTYLYPVLKNNVISYIIVVDFSTKPVNLIENNLQNLSKIFKYFIFIVILLISILLVFILYDIKRENKMRLLINKIKDLNSDLKKKIALEVEKSREKDRQLILQSRLALMGELLSMIAHQWRQPLNMIGSVISNLKMDLELDDLSKEKLYEYSNKIENTIKYLSHTIDDFRNFYKEDVKKERVNIDELIKEILILIEPSLKSKNINLELKLFCKKNISTYKNDLKQVILNILKNAEDVLIERKIRNPVIEIRTFNQKNNCVIEIKDNGKGIDINIKDEIFKPYFTTKSKKNGTGLGLYMSKMIIEKKIKGQLMFYNDSDGAVFKIVLRDENES